MSIWNKILVGLISVAAIGFFYLAVRATHLEIAWAEAVKNYSVAVERVNRDIELLEQGVPAADNQPAQLGVRQLAVRLKMLQADRRRVWTGLTPKIKTGKDDAEITLAQSADQLPHGIANSVVVYAFEQPNNKPGQFLGQFSVSNVAAKQLTLVPTGKLTAREVEKVKKAINPWALYEIMPTDDHEIFALIADDVKKASLPADSVAEYLKDGKPAAADDPADQKRRLTENGPEMYVRPLRDYRVLLDSERDQRMVLTSAHESIDRDSKLVETSLESARVQEEACKKYVAAEEEELKTATRKRDMVAAHLQKLNKKLADMQVYIAKLLETNRAKAGQIAKHQLEAARRIDQRTRAMAQSGSGRS